jgi:DNA-binding NtrC family response regulator
VKLLRVLQEGTVERVGGEKPLRINVRVIAATHRPLQAMVKRGSFRADLYYRLNVFPIEIPPLRERHEDIAPLVQHILAALAARAGMSVPTVPRETLAQLVEGEWPGNVRELANVLERALILSREGELHLELPTTHKAEVSQSRGKLHVVRTLAEATRDCIAAALTESGGRIYGPDGAAAKLGLKPSTLQGKMQKYRIDRSAFTRD